MYEHIKELADGAIALQNKDRMDAALREISALCALASYDGAKLIGFVDAGTAFPFDRAADAAPGDALAAAKPGDTVHVTDIENTETGESQVLSVKVTPAKTKKGGAK